MGYIPFDLLAEGKARLAASVDLVSSSQLADGKVKPANIRIDHRTVVTRDNAPAVHLAPQEDRNGKRSNACAEDHEFDSIVSLFVRDDAGYVAAGPLLLAIVRALDPNVTPYSYGAQPTLLATRFASDIADGDALRIDLHFRWTWRAVPWRLDEAPT